jgi:hypothetical protein
MWNREMTSEKRYCIKWSDSYEVSIHFFVCTLVVVGKIVVTEGIVMYICTRTSR